MYDVAANWKIVTENYSECYHCPGVHPDLNRLTPYDPGHNLESGGPWAGGWMELVSEFETMCADRYAADGLRTAWHPHPTSGLSNGEQRRLHAGAGTAG